MRCPFCLSCGDSQGYRQRLTVQVKMRNPNYCYWGKESNGLSVSPRCSQATDANAAGYCPWGSPGVQWSETATIANQNDVVTFNIGLTAPTTLGTYDSYWKMISGGVLYGPQVGKQITVVAACPWDIIKTVTSIGKVDGEDLTEMNRCYAPLGGIGTGCQASDLNNNGVSML